MNQIHLHTQQGSVDTTRLNRLMHSRSILQHLIYSMEHDVSYRDEQATIASLKVELQSLERSICKPALHGQVRIKETAH